MTLEELERIVIMQTRNISHLADTARLQERKLEMLIDLTAEMRRDFEAHRSNHHGGTHDA